jgi:flagellin
MAQVINSNISSLNAQRNLNSSQASLATSLQRLSSGLRINSAKDDAAGLAISERFTTQIRGNEQAARNANDGISLAQTAEGDLNTISNNLQRMRELAVQAANATNSDSDRAAINGEVQSLIAEIDRVSQNSSFNGTKLLDGSFTAKNFQIGANNSSSDVIQISSIASARTSDLGSAGTSYAATKNGTATTNALAAGDLTLNGIQVGASQLGTSPGQSTASAYSIAAAINAVSSQSGVTATANPNTVSGTGAAITDNSGIAANTFSINGVTIGAVAAGTTDAGTGANIAAEINKVSSQTGVTATADATTGALTLTAADGRDINIGLLGQATGADAGAAATAATANQTAFLAKTGLTAANVGLQEQFETTTNTVTAAADNAENHGSITLSSTSSAGIVLGGANVAYAGLDTTAATATTTSSVYSIASVNVLTAANASKALDAIDGALQTINTSRASLGAYQNRFATVVDSLQTRTENLTASRSRITDADFAKETANLTRAQILQQAGTAMLSQANQLPQGVLSLLR